MAVSRAGSSRRLRRRHQHRPCERVAVPESPSQAAAGDVTRAKRAHQGWLAAPIAGRVLTDDARRLAGRGVDVGETVLEIGQLDSMHVVLFASERVVSDLAFGAAAELRLRSDPARAVRFRLQSVDWSPARGAVLGQPLPELVDPEKPATRFYARAALGPDLTAGLRPGMTGIARVDAPPLSILQRLSRTYARLVRADFWL